MAQLISNVLMQQKPTDAVERPLTLIEKLRNKRNEWASNPHYWMDSNLIGDVFSDVIRTVKAHSDWVRCDERLPSDGVKVLTWHPRKEKFFIASFDKELNLWLENGSPCSSNFLYSITHWRELPQPPSEVQDD